MESLSVRTEPRAQIAELRPPKLTPEPLQTDVCNLTSDLVLFVFRRLNDRTRPTNHVMQRSPRRDHRVDSIFLVDFEIYQYRPLVFTGRLDRRHDFGTL